MTHIQAIPILLLLGAAVSSADEVQGVVRNASGATATVVTRSGTKPGVGDRVEFYFQIPGDEVSVARGQVTGVTSDSVQVRVEQGTAPVQAGHLARFSPKGSGGAGRPQSPGTLNSGGGAPATVTRPGVVPIPQLAGKWSFNDSRLGMVTLDANQSGDRIDFVYRDIQIHTWIANGKILCDQPKDQGTISSDGNRIQWDSGEVWTRIGPPANAAPQTYTNTPRVFTRPDNQAAASGGSVATQRTQPTVTNTPQVFQVPAAQGLQLAGKWSYLVGDILYSVGISQSGNSVTFTDQANRTVEGRIENGKIVVDAWKMEGTIAGVQIRWNNGAVWTRSGGTPAGTVAPPNTTAAARPSGAAAPNVGKASVCLTGKYAVSASLTPQGYLDFGVQNDTATLQTHLAEKIRMLYGCRYITPDQVSSLFADLSVLIARKVPVARCFGGDSGATGTDRNAHKRWAEQHASLDNLLGKIASALVCMNRTDQASFFSDASITIAGSMGRQ